MLDEARPAVDTATAICARHGNDPSALIEILHDLQAAEGFVPEAALPAIAQALNLGRAEVHGVVSFYHDFRRAPAARVEVQVCQAEACRAVGAAEMAAALCARRGAGLGETSGGVELKAVCCLGNCALGPAARVNGRLHGRLGADALEALIASALEGRP